MLDLLLEEQYASPLHSATSWVPFDYQRLPATLRVLAAKLLYLPRRRRNRQDPDWPVAPAADLLRHWLGAGGTSPWGATRWGLCITHDVDTVRGLRRCPSIAEVVEALGFRSCFYVVGEAAKQEPGIVRELADRGHEIGSHDVVHDNRLHGLPDGQLETRLAQARDLIRPYGGVGFRAPSLMRTPRLVEAVGRQFAYDTSLCDTDLEFSRGCTTVRPYRLRGCVELPVSIPMDSSLTYVGSAPDRMVALWREKCGYIRGLGGLAMSVTHAEPHLTGGPKLLEALRRFLEWAAEQEDCVVQLPSEVAQGWSSLP